MSARFVLLSLAKRERCKLGYYISHRRDAGQFIQVPQNGQCNLDSLNRSGFANGSLFNWLRGIFNPRLLSVDACLAKQHNFVVSCSTDACDSAVDSVVDSSQVKQGSQRTRRPRASTRLKSNDDTQSLAKPYKRPKRSSVASKETHNSDKDSDSVSVPPERNANAQITGSRLSQLSNECVEHDDAGKDRAFILHKTKTISSEWKELSNMQNRTSDFDTKPFSEGSAFLLENVQNEGTKPNLSNVCVQHDSNEKARAYQTVSGDWKQFPNKETTETPHIHVKIDMSDPAQIFQALLVSKPSGMLKHEKDALAHVFRHFLETGWALEEALHRCYVSSVVFPIAVSRFRKFFFSRCTPEVRTHLLELGPSERGDRFLFPLFSEFASREFPGEIARYKALVERADLTKPHTWFPFARAMKRKIIYHSGPTNSGKTYNAIQQFKIASSGIYCGPLRLLAMEVFDSVNADGVYCSLTTGQEKKEVPFANHVSCTVEMVSTQKTWEVAVIDEIQMLADEFRGWAWTRAFLGLQANEIHVCGDPSALGLVRDMCAITGDEMEEHSYERFEPLKIDKQSLEGKYGNIQPGDCIVSFSRKEIFSIKRAVELATTNRCCVIYGALPPETRRHQAKLFNDPKSGFDVLVATDAVGMGLNLNIRRVVFHSLEKYNGESLQKVSPSQVKQIAGRAGRRGTLYQAGIATTFYSRDIPYLVQCMEEPFVDTLSAGLFPMYEQIELFATQMPEATFSKLLDRFAETCRVDGSFFLCRNDNLKKVAGIIDKVKGLTLEDKMSFILAPVNSRDPKVIGALLSFAVAYSKKLPVHLSMVAPTGSARSVVQLMDLETRHQVLSLYLWLSHHFPEEYFPQKEQAGQMAAEIALLLGESLAQTDIRVVAREYRAPVRRKRPSKFVVGA